MATCRCWNWRYRKLTLLLLLYIYILGTGTRGVDVATLCISSFAWPVVYISSCTHTINDQTDTSTRDEMATGASTSRIQPTIQPRSRYINSRPAGPGALWCWTCCERAVRAGDLLSSATEIRTIRNSKEKLHDACLPTECLSKLWRLCSDLQWPRYENSMNILSLNIHIIWLSSVDDILLSKVWLMIYYNSYL